MREFLKIMANDIKEEHFTKSEFFIYGFILPMAFFVICLAAEWLTELAVNAAM